MINANTLGIYAAYAGTAQVLRTPLVCASKHRTVNDKSLSPPRTWHLVSGTAPNSRAETLYTACANSWTLDCRALVYIVLLVGASRR